MKHCWKYLLAGWLCLWGMGPLILQGYNLRRITNVDGLANSAVLSVYQDEDGWVWMGTCDGVHLFDGLTVSRLSLPDNLVLAGNIIEDIAETEPNIFWIQTNYGLNRYDRKKQTVTTYSQFQGRHRLRKNRSNDLFVLIDDNKVYCRSHVSGSFHRLHLDDETDLIIDIYATDSLWLFSQKGVYRCPLHWNDKGDCDIERMSLTDSTEMSYCFMEGHTAYLVDTDCRLWVYDIPSNKKLFVADIRTAMQHRGAVSDIVRRGNCFFIAFQTDGVLKLSPLQETDRKYVMEDMGIRSGIFRLLKDRRQDVIWVGTDGQGMVICSEGPYSIRSITYADLNFNIANPVRSIFLDRTGSLWLGTKGEGILRITDYEHGKPVDELHTEQITMHNSRLLDNSVYAFSDSHLPIFWIGGDQGLNYYSYTDKTIRQVQTEFPLRYVHALSEEGDSVLWIATVGTGIYKARIGGSYRQPCLENIQHYTIDNGNFSSNYFFSLSGEPGTAVFGNRGYGAFALEGEELRQIPLHDQHWDKTVNDVFAVVRDGNTLWLGTGHGVIKKTADSEKCFGKVNGWPNSTIHTMLRDNRQHLWAATNIGLIRMNTVTEEWQTYGRDSGLEVVEFSDGASLRAADGTLFFGGINGLVVVREDTAYCPPSSYLPPVRFTHLYIGGREENLYDYLSYEEDDKDYAVLQLDYHQNHFSLSFIATDHINASNYSYLYKMNEEAGWINQGLAHAVSFTQLPPGHYRLRVKYLNQATGQESPVYTLAIRVRPPWYLSATARIAYVLAALALLALMMRNWMVRQERKQERIRLLMEQAHKEELYEEKLRFFTNITHEFCTPLTLIYGPCEHILHYAHADAFIRKYIGLIKQNAERLNMLIQEIIEFRRIETGHKMRKIQLLAVSQTCREILASFADLAEQHQIELIDEVQNDLQWHTDLSCFTKIVNNLLSNAFKYTSPQGTIRLGLSAADDCLCLRVYNTGKGIQPADHARIFNRYSVLDNVEGNTLSGISSRNGLGMAICQSMVELLEGHIEIESEVDKYACFVVTLPMLPLVEQGTMPVLSAASLSSSDNVGVLPEVDEHAKDVSAVPLLSENEKRHILVIDDSPEILSLLQDCFAPYYRVTAVANAKEGLEVLKEDVPELIITDILMPGTDGLELTRQIKQNKHTMHIPLVILSAKNSNDEKIKGLESGADVYVGKPFNINYLKAIVDRMIANKEQMKEYYNSSACAYEFVGGTLMQKEDKAFLEQVIRFIDENIDNAELTQDDLANHLQISTRNLYRKFKELELLPPKDFIKDYRISFAAKLLQTTTLTIQEIIYRSGFNNRSHFYKEFDKHFQMTPKDYRHANKQKDDSLGEKRQEKERN